MNVNFLWDKTIYEHEKVCFDVKEIKMKVCMFCASVIYLRYERLGQK